MEERIAGRIMSANLTTTTEHTKFPAGLVLVALLTAGFLTKLGFAWLAIGLMASLCLLEPIYAAIMRWHAKRNAPQPDHHTLSGAQIADALAAKADLPLAA